MPLIFLQSELVDSAALMENKALQRLAAIVTMLIAWGVICSPTETGKKAFFLPFTFCVCGYKQRKRKIKESEKTHVMKLAKLV